MEKMYIGDGVYAEYEAATYSIILTTEDGIKVTNRIVLEAEVLANLNKYITRTIFERYSKKENKNG